MSLLLLQWIGMAVDVTTQRTFRDVAFVQIAAQIVQRLHLSASGNDFHSFLRIFILYGHLKIKRCFLLPGQSTSA